MKKIKGLVLRSIGSEYVIVAESLDLIEFDRMVALNGSAAFVWEYLDDEAEFDADTVAQLLCRRYEVEYGTARADAGELLDKWLTAGIIEN